MLQGFAAVNKRLSSGGVLTGKGVYIFRGCIWHPNIRYDTLILGEGATLMTSVH